MRVLKYVGSLAIRGDGSAPAVLMREAYGWALQNPVRRIFYNIGRHDPVSGPRHDSRNRFVAPEGGSCSRPQQRLLGPGAILHLRHLGYGMVAVSIVI